MVWRRLESVVPGDRDLTSTEQSQRLQLYFEGWVEQNGREAGGDPGWHVTAADTDAVRCTECVTEGEKAACQTKGWGRSRGNTGCPGSKVWGRSECPHPFAAPRGLCGDAAWCWAFFHCPCLVETECETLIFSLVAVQDLCLVDLTSSVALAPKQVWPPSAVAVGCLLRTARGQPVAGRRWRAGL